MALTGPQKTVAQTVGVVILMGSLAWAAVPFYDWFCRVTGFGGTTGVAESAPEDILDRTITVRFDASKAKGMAWEFKPIEREMEVRIGETGLAFYEAYNPTDRPIAGQASYNVAPYSAGGYFQKIACFCFEEQVLQPGERVEMPVTFFVDPELVDDLEAKYVHTITLSYTFYEIDLPEGYAALETQADTNTN
ncbi:MULTISPECIES: cytochrome c oxidase assembly protein [unclassified Ruegeria]|uniref:cytochrome c oxidase assembly protein n=1 Tax=unclassified Ruegeria TaxID=2625375 RepID=UPI00148964FA|nr:MULTISPECIES: cytochrome c oxidase assembly protein [unclassified Ruegeria]NOD62619.1 cytochrome c oxidase assembly protein [Ruegeria sp. HKCCD6109]NOD77086.1 cytochrome c oxidase assembly protein [Ruegeria sp. HKCCD4332]NOD89557.1 cytochrome c oxidase assembly protein [Ruegeria sp. HKCCD4318]NOD92991.1 cytochrome c oxidase assembly protein [Ruegeria sp. HKCCD4884]NOE13880.1 cytochrome c oxidase assembly protein [Ruegeria sp. HKCCD4318-2]